MKVSASLTVGVSLLVLLFTSLVTASTIAGPAVQVCNVPGQYGTIQAAIDDSNCSEIILASGTFYEAVTIARTVQIQGQGPADTTIDGVAAGAVIGIDGSNEPAMRVSLEGLAIANGSSDLGGGIYSLEATLYLTDTIVAANYASDHGGGIYSELGGLNVVSSTIRQNVASIGGGVWVDSGTANLTNSTVSNNAADGFGGGLYVGEQATATLDGISLTTNVTSVDGGGLINSGTIVIRDSAFYGNESLNYSGGAIRNEGTAYISNTTFSNNKAVIGEAGIDNDFGVLRLYSSTVANNSGGGINGTYSDVVIQNSIVSGNVPNDCRGPVKSNGYNIVENDSACSFQAATGDLVGVPANLGAFQGDPGFHPLLLGPGINGGNPDGCLDHLGQPLLTDQRGMPRVGRCDIGAVEYQGDFQQIALPLLYQNFCSGFHDDFSNPNSGWPSGEDSYVRYGYVNGEYQIFSKIAGYLYLFTAPACDRENYVVEVDSRWSGAPGNSYGIFFGLVGNFEKYYLFDLNSEHQMYRLLYRSPSGWETIVPVTASGAIHAGSASNHLKVTRSGSQIILQVNGTVLNTLTDTRISGATGAGILASAYSNGPSADARFDNFSMIQLGASAAASNGADGAQSAARAVPDAGGDFAIVPQPFGRELAPQR